MSGRRVAPDPISATLALLQDTQKFEARLKQLTEAEKSLRETTDKYEKIADLNRNKAAAKRVKDRAEAALAEAEEKAKAMVTEAEQSASALRQAVQNEKSEFEKESRKKTSELTEREGQLASNEVDYDKRIAANDRREATIARKAAAQQSRKKELDRLVNKLKAVCNEVLA